MSFPFNDSRRVLALILGGGAGTRLFPLTLERAKPAVPLAGKYRLVDIPISLCINSGLKRIFLLTQYLSSSLHRHVYQSYRFDDYVPRGFIEILAASQTSDGGEAWYQGTADAVRRNLMHLRTHEHDLVLILSGDQLYRMDYREILAQHVNSGSDITVATIPVVRDDAKGFGIMQINEEREVVRFVEKPKEDKLLESLRIPAPMFGELGIKSDSELFLASMGIYVFNRETLEEMLADEKNEDFGKHIIPKAIESKKVTSYIYQGYWEDIGTIKAFYSANLDLTEEQPKFSFYDARSPIYTRARFLPGSKLYKSVIERSIISDGCIIRDAEINHCSIGLRSRIESGVKIKDTIIMGADFFENPEAREKNAREGRPNVGIGSNTVIEGALIDKNARIGSNVVIRAAGKSGDSDHPLYCVRDGIVVIPKGKVIPDGTII